MAGLKLDCPLPSTDADIETAAYINSLNPACRRQHDEFPDSTLHVSSEEYIRDLTRAQSKGLVVFTVDYCLDPVNVAWVYNTSRTYGFIPFCGERALATYFNPVP